MRSVRGVGCVGGEGVRCGGAGGGGGFALWLGWDARGRSDLTVERIVETGMRNVQKIVFHVWL